MNLKETLAKDLFTNIDSYWEVIPKIKDFFSAIKAKYRWKTLYRNKRKYMDR